MLVNDYLRFALKIFIYPGVLHRTPFVFRHLVDFYSSARFLFYLLITGNFRFVGYSADR